MPDDHAGIQSVVKRIHFMSNAGTTYSPHAPVCNSPLTRRHVSRQRTLPRHSERQRVSAGLIRKGSRVRGNVNLSGVTDTLRRMRIGYGRVSTTDQNPDAQRDALTAAGCEQIFLDKASGKLASRPELDKALLVANRPGDQLVVTKLDRLGRTLTNLIDLSKGMGRASAFSRRETRYPSRSRWLAGYGSPTGRALVFPTTGRALEYPSRAMLYSVPEESSDYP
ncbi:hypothetical protein ABIA39_007852 [Nocardia sp. GAS34]|uniref:recombinase family protein n=1 Tax=unclassified Nocardia TaxID=2637762 RepID=UPI003D1A00EC